MAQITDQSFQGYDEVLWTFLFLNPLLTNVAWPGLGVPTPPVTVGSRAMDDLSLAGMRAAAYHVRKSLFEWRGRRWGCHYDEVSMSCLLSLGYVGKWASARSKSILTRSGATHPLDFLKGYAPAEIYAQGSKGRESKRGHVVVFGLDKSFTAPCTVRRFTNKNHTSPLLIQARFMVVGLKDGNRNHIYIRPAGLNLEDASSPIQRVELLLHDRESFVHSKMNDPNFDGRVDLILERFPTTQAGEDATLFCLRSPQTRELVSEVIKGGSNKRVMSVAFQKEATELLNGRPGRAMKVSDLCDSAKWLKAGAGTRPPKSALNQSTLKLSGSGPSKPKNKMSAELKAQYQSVSLSCSHENATDKDAADGGRLRTEARREW